VVVFSRIPYRYMHSTLLKPIEEEQTRFSFRRMTTAYHHSTVVGFYSETIRTLASNLHNLISSLKQEMVLYVLGRLICTLIKLRHNAHSVMAAVEL